SEMSAELRPASTVQQHVRDHVGDFVATTTFIKDGVVWVHPTGRFGRAPMPLADSYFKLYVDPRTGLLRRNKQYRTRQQRQRDEAAEDARKRAPRMRELAPDLQVHRFANRGWWEVKLAHVEWRPETYVAANGETRTRYYEFAPDVVYHAGFSKLPRHELYG